MTYPFYKDVLREIGYKIQYEAISNLYGDSYAGKERSDIVEQYNPFRVNNKGGNTGNKQKVTIGFLQQIGIVKN